MEPDLLRESVPAARAAGTDPASGLGPGRNGVNGSLANGAPANGAPANGSRPPAVAGSAVPAVGTPDPQAGAAFNVPAPVRRELAPETLLEPLGMSPLHSDVYLDLLAHPRSGPADQASRLDIPIPRVRKVLQRLLDAGLATRLAGAKHCYVAAPPDVALDALVQRHTQRLERLRLEAHELALRVRPPAPPAEPSELIELVEGREAVNLHLARMQLSAREEVLIIDAPPYLHGRPVPNDEEIMALGRGVSYRSLYHAPGLEDADHLAQALACIAAGEQARALPSVRMKMIIADRSLALLPISFSAAETGTRILVHKSPLLDALVMCFESLWAQGTPLGATPAGQEEVSESDRRLLAMLASGAKDRAIARALGVTERTVGRRIQELMTQLKASTRFQAGLQAARRGWL